MGSLPLPSPLPQGSGAGPGQDTAQSLRSQRPRAERNPRACFIDRNETQHTAALEGTMTQRDSNQVNNEHAYEQGQTHLNESGRGQWGSL